MAAAADTPEWRALKRRNLNIGALALALSSPADWLAAGHVVWSTTVVHLGAAALLAGVGWAVGRGSLAPHVGGAVVALALTLVTPVLLFLIGAEEAVYQLATLMPLAFLALAPDNRQAAILALVGTGGGVVGIQLLSGQPPGKVLFSLAYLSTVGVLVLYGVKNFRELHLAERRSDEARIAALEQLSRSEERRAEAERMAVIGRLAAGVAHEVNNPLAAAAASVRFVGDELAAPSPEGAPAVTQALEDATESLHRIQLIVQSLSLFARGDAGDGPGDVAAALEESIRLAATRLRPPVRLERQIDAPLPAVPMSKERLSQVLVHLLLNSADALDGLRPHHTEPWVGVTVRAADGVLKLVVEDTGPGIPEASLEQIFEPFFTTKPGGKGTGMGLALCREYVQRAGGTIKAENRPERGARFTVEFPLGAAHTSDSPPPLPPVAAQGF